MGNGRKRGKAAKAGMPPGSPVYLGSRNGKSKITVMDYGKDCFLEKEVGKVEECFEFRKKSTVTWINVDGIHNTKVIEKIGAMFDLHPLVLEDILNTDQRPKIEDVGDYIYIVFRMFSCGQNEGKMHSEQVSLVLGKNFVISFQETEGDVFGNIRERIRVGKGKIRTMGADYLAYNIMDAVVDNYFIILERIGEEVESLEDKLINNPKPELLRRIHRLKRDAIYLRRAVWPLREVINELQRGTSSLIKKSTAIYLRDLYDHTIQVIDTIESVRDITSSLVDIYLSSTSNKLNEIMKVLTVIATIFIPLTFVTGIYGMNFENMPELSWEFGYFTILITMAIVGIVMVHWFRKNRWI